MSIWINKVDNLFQVKSFNTVHHMVSDIMVLEG